MEDYKDKWIEMVKKSPIDGTLEALTVAALKNSSSEYNKKFSSLWGVISRADPINGYTKKLKDIYLTIHPVKDAQKKQEEFTKWWE